MREKIFFAIGIFLLFYATPASAITAQELAAATPISSHYVQKILERVDAGIQGMAEGGSGGGPIFETMFGDWASFAATPILSLLDITTTPATQNSDLLEVTACLHLDVAILEAKIEQLRKAQHEELKTGKISRLIQLNRMIRFLGDRIVHLKRGAYDPNYEDTGWSVRQPFDTPGSVWCCAEKGMPGNACTQTESEQCVTDGGMAFLSPRGCDNRGCVLPGGQSPIDGKMCPFHSDYLDPVSSGYGCDEEILANIVNHPAFVAEAEALKALLGERLNLAILALRSREITSSLDRIVQTPRSTDLPTPPVRTHRSMEGCIEEIPEAEGLQTGESLFGKVGITASPLRGPFSIEKNEPGILQRFMTLHNRWATQRPNPDALKEPNEYPPGSEREEVQKRETEKNPLIRAGETVQRLYLRWWSYYHGRHEPRPIPRGQDLPEQVEASMGGGLLKATERLAKLTESHTTGLRSFGKGFAYFLRRSCVYRPCNQRLEQVLKILFTDECFPYTGDAWKSDDEQYKKCVEKAKISTDL